VKKSDVIKQNVKYILFNWIKDYCWHNKPINQSYENYVKYVTEMEDVEKDMTVEEAKRYLIDYVQQTQSEKGIDTFIKELLWTHRKTSFGDLMKEAELDFKNKRGLQRFIANHILSEIA